MEKSVLWCLQPKYRPEGLIVDKDELVHHVLCTSDDRDTPSSTHLSQYDFSVRRQGGQQIDSPVGRYQAELLLRSAHRAIDNVSVDPQKVWEGIDDSCYWLRDHGLFDNYLEKDIVHRMSSPPHSLYL